MKKITTYIGCIAAAIVIMGCVSSMPVWATSTKHGYASILESETGIPTSGVPNGNGGFSPPDMVTGAFASRDCRIDFAGGNMGLGSYTGANFLMACDTQDTSGRFFTIWNNDNNQLPKTLFEVRRNGVTYINGLSIQHTLHYNQPVFYTPYKFEYVPTTGIGLAAINVTTDVPGDSVTGFPGIGIWGMVSQYGAAKPPLLSMFGATTSNPGLGVVQGTKRFTFTDDGIMALGAQTVLTNVVGGEIALANNRRLTWNTFASGYTTTAGIFLDANNTLKYGAAFDSATHSFNWPTGSDRLQFQYQNGGAGISFFQEASADHTAPTTNSAVIYPKDDGAGNTILVARFNTGSVFQIASQKGNTVTSSNCSSTGGTCGSAPAGSVGIAAAATTVIVSTTAVTANSQIFVQEDSSLGTKLGITCNTTIVRLYAVTARTPGTSFVITTGAAPVTNPACLSYRIVN